MDPKIFDDFAERIKSALPPSASAVQEDIAQQAKLWLHSALDKMDLVTRDDFDIQVSLLERVMTRLEDCEARLAALEEKNDAP